VQPKQFGCTAGFLSIWSHVVARERRDVGDDSLRSGAASLRQAFYAFYLIFVYFCEDDNFL
jgi:hypothetical protein